MHDQSFSSKAGKRVSPSTARSMGQIEPVGPWQQLAVEMTAPDHHQLRDVTIRQQGQCGLHRVDDLHAVGPVVGVAADHQIAAAGQRSRPMDSKVLRPISTGLPRVTRLKWARSAGRCQASGCQPYHPIVRHGGNHGNHHGVNLSHRRQIMGRLRYTTRRDRQTETQGPTINSALRPFSTALWKQLHGHPEILSSTMAIMVLNA